MPSQRISGRPFKITSVHDISYEDTWSYILIHMIIRGLFKK